MHYDVCPRAALQLCSHRFFRMTFDGLPIDIQENIPDHEIAASHYTQYLEKTVFRLLQQEFVQTCMHTYTARSNNLCGQHAVIRLYFARIHRCTLTNMQYNISRQATSAM